MPTVTIHTAPRTVTVEIPDTAQGWQLYSTMPGSDEAAVRLYAAFLHALTLPLPDAMAAAAAALEAEADFGAIDTEPRCEATTVLEAVFGSAVYEIGL